MTSQHKRVIVAGHSHADTLFGNCLRASVAPKLFKIDDGYEIYGLVGAFPRRPEYWRVLKDEARDSVVVVVWGGNDHNGQFLFEVDPAFDLVRADCDWVSPTAELVPAELVRHFFYSMPHVRESVDVMKALRDVPSCRPMLAETPPPKGDDASLRQFIQAEFSAFAEARGLSLETAPLTHPKTRLKVWRSMRDAYQMLAQDAGVEFLPLPDWVFDDAGFLKREYWHTDATHANGAYAAGVRAHMGSTLLQ